jgi:tRNA 2-thiouridine synthesizing protein A
MNPARADRIIDARDMEPPEPFVRTMEALDGIGAGEKLLLLLSREPHPLYRALEINGFAWQTERKPDGLVEILIWHKLP